MSADPIPQEPMPQMQNPAGVPALPAPPPEARPSSVRTGRCLVWILEFGLILALITALVAAYYFGWPVVYRQYVFPVQDHATRIAILETQQPAVQKQVLALQTQVPALALAAATADASISTLQAGHFDVLESSVDERFQAVAALQFGQATVQAGQTADLATLAPRVNALERAVKEHATTLADLRSTQAWMQATLQAGDSASRSELERRVTLLKSMELLSRARLFLYESNFGMAKQDIQAARDLLSDLYGYPPGPELAEVVQHLDQALARLPDFPVAASDDLDIAWQILLQFGRPTATPISPTSSETPTPIPTLPETPTPTPTS